MLELIVVWCDWMHAEGWEPGSKADAEASRLAAKIQEWVDALHRHSMRAALGLSFGNSEPGTGRRDTKRQPQFQGEVFNAAEGTFERTPDHFDWTNPAAREYAYRAWFDTAKRLDGLDFLFFNEPHYVLSRWDQVPFFSESALADYRRFRDDASVRLPAKPWTPETSRTDPSATVEDWLEWRRWVATVYQRRMRVCTDAFTDANRDNPRYGGAIWFQNAEWVGLPWGCDLDLIGCIRAKLQKLRNYVA